MKLKLLFFLILFTPLNFLFQSDSNKDIKLLVGIVVDQMRYDYLEKYWDYFSENGFKRLVNGGTNFTNCKINYIPTVTGAGHASIYTGTTPYFHGIIANDWKDRNSEESINCCSAISASNNIQEEGISRDRSPEQLLSTTIGDQLKLSNSGRSKVISISLKDRGALLPAGKSADGAFWFDEETGKFISSFYYYDELPEWVNKFNKSGRVESYLSKEWRLYKSPDFYKELAGDNLEYEADFFNEGKSSFPHSLKNIDEGEKFDKLMHTPFGNQIIVDFAKAAIVSENLGMHQYTDHLAISFSSTDKIGHEYGPQSYEVKDTYLRLDDQIADLLTLIDSQVGKENYLLFLTSDHGVMENTRHLLDMNFDAGELESTYLKQLNDFLYQKYGSNKIIKTSFKRNIYLDYDEIGKLGMDRTIVEKSIKEFFVSNISEIAEVHTRSELESMRSSRYSGNHLLNGFNNLRSGDILYSLKAHYLHSEREFGSKHGSGYSYDIHIPLIFYGNKIPVEKRNDEVYIIDIAPTISDILGINMPSSSIGKPLIEN